MSQHGRGSSITRPEGQSPECRELGHHVERQRDRSFGDPVRQGPASILQKLLIYTDSDYLAGHFENLNGLDKAGWPNTRCVEQLKNLADQLKERPLIDVKIEKVKGHIL